jgi:DNA processing protein
LAAGGTVVGVLGCGADVVYPVSNRQLFADTAQFGCILSEFPPGTPPVSWNFPKRNRIMSGLSCGVLVVEAPEKSGALITAHQALEQGRDVFVVPGNIDVDSCKGSNALLRDGAIAVSSGWDVVGEYEALYPDKIRRDTAPSHLKAYPDEVRRAEEEGERKIAKVAQKTRKPAPKSDPVEENTKKDIDKADFPPYSDLNKPKPKLSPEEQQIVDALNGGERLVDDVIAETGLTTGKLLASLTMLELKGIVKRLPGKRITLK